MEQATAIDHQRAPDPNPLDDSLVERARRAVEAAGLHHERRGACLLCYSPGPVGARYVSIAAICAAEDPVVYVRLTAPP